MVVCKNLTVSEGRKLLFDDLRYSFYISNDWSSPAEAVVFEANGRCDQENLIAQLNGGVWALRMPCQIIRQGRRVIYRLLSCNPWQGVFLRAVEAVRVVRC